MQYFKKHLPKLSLSKALLAWVVSLISGCAFIQTTSTPFHGEGHYQRGTITVLPLDKEQANSLQFRNVSQHLLRKLSEQGYTPVSSSSKPEFIAFITYGIDSGKVVNSSVPIYGQTGGGASFTSGNITNSSGRMSSFNATTTTMPTYGIVGSMPISTREYKRDVNIDIYRNVPSNAPTKVYEIRAFSSGSCGNINAVVNSILDGIFRNFPGQNGQSRRIQVEWNGSC